MVVRQGDVSRISNNVDYPAVAVVKVFMALDASWPRDPLQSEAGLRFGIRNQAFDIGECSWRLGMKQVCNQKASPGVSGSRVRNHKSIVRKNRHITPSNVLSQGVLYDVFDPVDRGSLG